MEHGKRGYWECYADNDGNNVISFGQREVRSDGRRSSESRRARMRMRQRILTGAALAALAVAIALIASKAAAPQPGAEGGAGSPQPSGVPSETDIPKKGETETIADIGDGRTVLVNAWHPLPKDYAPAAITDLMEIVAISDVSVCAADEVVSPLTKMINGAEEAGHTGLFVTSGYRTYDEQRRIYKESADKSYVQPAGCSEHQTGLAVDIMKLGVNMESFGDDPASEWLYENSWRYGFIVRYPQDKSEITGISYEPWHFRYVGKEVAKLCHEKNICLEEYAEVD
ncbi:MAG: M15 family metallopeptidase [Clostridiales Family XIII bacterium]|jgi:D-alanyl-D-alanine carboxypeptidase|nr:M15 family metallopeptidase [Clostridiales Family XIII bacterium]